MFQWFQCFITYFSMQWKYLYSSGKSFLIKEWAYTGVAAHLVSGQTINSFFKIPIRTKFIELKGDSLRAFQDKLDKVEYLILEEMSTIDQGLFGKIDSRLRQAFPHRADQVLGGCSVILLGDFAQIPPVAGTPLYSGILTDNTWLTAGRLAYGAFNNAVILQKVWTQISK